MSKPISFLTNIKSNYFRTIILAILGFVSTVIFSRTLGANLFGVYMYYTWLISTITLLLNFGFEGTITKFLPEYYYKNKATHSSSLISYIITKQIKVIIFGSILLIAAYPFLTTFGKINDIKFSFYILIIVIISPMMIMSITVSTIQALQRFDIFAKVNVTFQIITISINSVISFKYQNIIAMLGVIGITSLLQVIIYFKNIKTLLPDLKIQMGFNILKKDLKRIKNYAKYMYINIIWQQIVWNKSEFLFLSLYSSPKELAIYGLAYSLISIINYAISPIMSIVNNYFSKFVALNETKTLTTLINSISKYFVIVLIFIFTYAVLFSDSILTLIYTNEYTGVVTVFLLLLFGTVVSKILNVSSSLPFYFEKQKVIINLGILSGILNIVLDIALIPKYGAIGAATASTISQVFFSVVQFAYTKHLIKVIFPFVTLFKVIFVNTLVFISLFNVENNVLLIIYSIITIPFYLLILIAFKVIDIDEIKKLINNN
ncbi:oligosaccharide flippase family protein [Fictibacillus iocasae]|uniref:Oligosaccharide flippase family protein n=1 Tax=Fictibacillus iocasae TaxID=2715437 RepID=A0ABW2NP04_9BACL